MEEEIPRLVAATCARLAGASDPRRGAAVAAILTRHLTLAGEAWVRWPEWAEPAVEGIRILLERIAGLAVPSERQQNLVAWLREFDVQDDGSEEWQHVVDLFGSVDRMLGGAELDVLLEHAARGYLEGAFSAVANRLADQEERGVISQADAWRRVPSTPEWQEATAFLDAV